MKSKAFILHQIGELLDKNRGMCEDEIVQWKEDNKDKTVYELLVIKKDLAEKKYTKMFHLWSGLEMTTNKWICLRVGVRLKIW